MNCNKCNNPGVRNTALNKVFYYCRVCKDEIKLEEAKITFDPSAWDSYYSNTQKFQVGSKVRLMVDIPIFNMYKNDTGVIMEKSVNLINNWRVKLQDGTLFYLSETEMELMP